MKIRKPKYEGNLMQFLPKGKEEELIQELLEILEELNWTIASKVNPDSNQMEGFIVGNDDFINDILTKLDESGNNIDINEVYLGDNEDLN